MLQRIMENALGRIVWTTLKMLITQRMFSRILSSLVWFFAEKTATKVDDKFARDLDRALGLDDNSN